MKASSLLSGFLCRRTRPSFGPAGLLGGGPRRDPASRGSRASGLSPASKERLRPGASAWLPEDLFAIPR